VRIIAGRFKGRQIQTLADADFRPTSGLVKEALFSSISSLIDLNEKVVLDLYAGSGGFGFEALSRGVSFVVFIEKNRKLVGQLKTNIEQLGLNNEALVINQNLHTDFFKSKRQIELLQTSSKYHYFDIIFIDPPYNLLVDEQYLEAIISSNLIANEALIIVEQKTSKDQVAALELVQNSSLKGKQVIAELIKNKTYGQTQLLFYRVMKNSTVLKEDQVNNNTSEGEK
jgi:16S rRNA (guanine966-N2)-methyltransferase